jgi:hypothetical protein
VLETGSERAYELAYAVSLRAIEDQATVLESLRSRAGTLFAATAIVTSFVGGGAVSRSAEHLTLVSYASGAVALFVAVALLTLAILLPYRMRFSISAAAILTFIDDPANPVEPKEVLRELALRYEAMADINSRQLRRLGGSFQLAIVCLLGEIGFWIAPLVGGTS